MAGFVDLLLSEMARSAQVSIEDKATQRSSLNMAWERATSAWPGVTIDPALFAKRLAGRLTTAGGTLPVMLRHLSDVYLAEACALGDVAAFAAFESILVPVVAGVTKREGRGINEEDLRQLVRVKVLVAAEGRQPRIAEYAGKASLRQWVKVVATRIALDQRDAPHEVSPDVGPAEPAGEDFELDYLRRAHGQKMKQLLPGALASLGLRERSLLRYRHVEGLTVRQIAAVYGEPKSTVARWLGEAEATLGAAIRAQVMRDLAISDGALDSLVRLVWSDLKSLRDALE